MHAVIGKAKNRKSLCLLILKVDDGLAVGSATSLGPEADDPQPCFISCFLFHIGAQGKQQHRWAQWTTLSTRQLSRPLIFKNLDYGELSMLWAAATQM